MRLLIVIVAMLATFGMACDNLPIGGKCYDAEGNELPVVIDADGVEWDTTRVNYEVFGESSTGCGISRSATTFDTPYGPSVYHPDGTGIRILQRHEDKWVLSSLATDWY